MFYHYEDTLYKEIYFLIKNLNEYPNYYYYSRNFILSIVEMVIITLNAKYNNKTEKVLFPELIIQFVYDCLTDYCYDNTFIFQELPAYRQYLKNRVIYLKKVPQPEQRSDEWYLYRNARITASDSASIINRNHYKTRNKLLLDKVHPQQIKQLTSECIRHGVMFEEVVCEIYQHLEKTQVTEYGCLPHDTISFIGASPDGIDNNGIMLEIKCPSSRHIYGLPTYVYWHQIQQQLEVADLNICHYVEALIVKINRDNYTEIIKQYPEQYPYFSGIVIEYYDLTKKKLNYKYSNYGNNYKQNLEWENTNVDIILKNKNIDYRNTIYWKLETYAKLDIYRDRLWFKNIYPEFKQFWDEVTYFRQYPEKLKIKEKKKYNSKPNSCLISTDSDDDS